MRMVGHHVDGSAATYERIGADPEQGVPIIALRPSI
jgi:hypothetical protein